MSTAPDPVRLASPVDGPLRCASCEYDLTGLPETGRCPECSHSIDESIRSLGGWTARRLRTLRLACVSFAAGWLPWLAFGLAMLLRPTMFLRGLVGAFIITHALLLEASMLAATAAGSTRPPRGRLLIMALTTLPMTACAIVLSLLIVQWITIGPSPEVVVVASAASRAVIVWFAAWWLGRSHRSLKLADVAWRRAPMIGISLSLAAWGMATAIMIVEATGLLRSRGVGLALASFEVCRWAMVIDIGTSALAGIAALRLARLAHLRLRAIRESVPAS